MALPDISNLTAKELLELLNAADNLYRVKEQEELDARTARRESVGEAIAHIEAILGPEGSTKNTNTIRGVLGYTDAEMAANAGIAFRRSFQGLEQIAMTLLDVAHIIARS